MVVVQLLTTHRTRYFVSIFLQIVILSLLTLITTVALIHVSTMLLFRRLVIGGGGGEQQLMKEDEEEVQDAFFIPVKRKSPHVGMEDSETVAASLSLPRRVLTRTTALIQDLPTNFRRTILRNSGITKEIYMRYFIINNKENPSVLLLCNPSGETVDSLHVKAISLAKDIGFDTLVMFDYRPTGRSCKGLVAPNTVTMLEDTETVFEWLLRIQDIPAERISVAGISLGGVQAMRLALKNPGIANLLLINTFSSFSCILGSSASLLPGALRNDAFLPDISADLKAFDSSKKCRVAIISVTHDERIPLKCTEELVKNLNSDKTIHIVMEGTHSNPVVDWNSMQTLRDFLRF